jgi:mannose-6-phosphate isomerase-like protein (cupin superfamily)
MFVIEGQGIFKSGNAERPIGEGDVITVLPGEQHSVLNSGKNLLRVICVVPLVAGKMPGMNQGD